MLHPSFTFNGLQYDSVEELLLFAEKLVKDGDEHEVQIGKFIQQWLNEKEAVKVKTSEGAHDQ